uniref:Uncharacterized protein n=1 Tax=Rhizophagus irregularis (strain DAOM 181602 / DAOM 197198 / MUCL 43194) TaxID=747089 RepID=U9UL53_RHIID
MQKTNLIPKISGETIKVTQSSSASSFSTTGNNELQDSIYDIKDAIVNDG